MLLRPHSYRFAHILKSLSLAMVCLTALSSAAELVAQINWPQFRGEGGSGAAATAQLPTEFSESKNLKWQQDVPGRGWSSPVVWENKIWLTTASEDGKQMYALSYDRQTGNPLQNILVFENEKPRFCHPTNSYASPTPVVEPNRVYVHFGSYGTACLDATTGKKLWERRDLPCNHWRGPGSSPVITGDVLIVPFDGYDLQYVVGLDKNSGKTLWKQDRNIDYGTNNGDRMKAYATALILRDNDQYQAIIPSAGDTVSYHPETGSELWRLSHGGMNACIPPAYQHGLVYLITGSNGRLLAVDPTVRGKVDESSIRWEHGRGVPKRPSPVFFGDSMVFIDDSGVATCLNAKTGKSHWQKRIGGSYRASPVIAGKHIYFFSLDGDCPVIEAGTEYKLVAKNKMDDGFQASPAIVGDNMYLRTTKRLLCISSTTE